MSFSFQTRFASRGFHIFKNTIWKNFKMGEEISVQIKQMKHQRKLIYIIVL